MELRLADKNLRQIKDAMWIIDRDRYLEAAAEHNDLTKMGRTTKAEEYSTATKTRDLVTTTSAGSTSGTYSLSNICRLDVLRLVLRALVMRTLENVATNNDLALPQSLFCSLHTPTKGLEVENGSHRPCTKRNAKRPSSATLHE